MMVSFSAWSSRGGGRVVLWYTALDCPILNVPGEVFCFYHIATTQHKGIFDGVFQLPNISWETITHQHNERIIGYSSDLLAFESIEFLDKMIY